MRLFQAIRGRVGGRKPHREDAKRRFRWLLIEQFEDRRVLATAHPDDYSVVANGVLSAGGTNSPWSNDDYSLLWDEESCTNGGEWVTDYDENGDPQGQHWECSGETYSTQNYVGGNIASWPEHGELTPSWSDHIFSFSYEPDPDFQGIDSFEYTITDSSEGGSSATVTIRVGDEPVGLNDFYAAGMNTELSVEAEAGVLLNDLDDDSTALTAAVTDPPLHGQVELEADGSFVYTPVQDFTGWDSFTYSPSDSGNWPAQSTLVLIRVDLPPSVGNDNYIAAESTPLVVSASGLLTNDEVPSGMPLEIYDVIQPSHGTLSWNADGSFVYTPVNGYTGSDSFTYHANSNAAISAAATVTLRVVPISEALEASDNSYTTPAGGTLEVMAAEGVLANDSGSGTRTAFLLSEPIHGTLEFHPDGSFVYQPYAASYTGPDSFSYRFSDGQTASAAALVTIYNQSTPDLGITGFYSDCLDLQVQYVVLGTGGQPFAIQVYAEVNGVLAQQALPMQSVTFDTTVGVHTTTVHLAFNDWQEGYYLVAKIVSSSNEAMVDEIPANNQLRFAGGSFVVQEPSGKKVLHYQGTDGSESPVEIFRDEYAPYHWHVNGAQTAVATPDSPWAGLYDVTGDNLITARDAEAIRNYAAGQSGGWHNTTNPFDVNADDVISPADALAVINYLGAHGETVLHGQRQAGELQWDVNGDIVVSVLDVRQLFDLLNGGDGVVAPEGRSGSVNLGSPASGQTYADAIEALLSSMQLDLGALTVNAVHIRMHDGDDAALANRAPAWIFGGNGNDAIWGSMNDDDFLDGGVGNDNLNGRGHDDQILGGDGDDWLSGDDTDVGSSLSPVGVDHIYGGLGNDTIYGNGANDQIYAGLGNDTIEGGPGEDLIYGDDGPDDDATAPDDGNDTIYGGKDIDTIYGEGGDDVLHSKASYDYSFTEAGDIIYGGNGDDTFYGWSGDDQFYGGSGNDTLNGGGGFDTLRGGAGNDTLAGGYGDDILFGDEGIDGLYGGDGIDELDGGSGADAEEEEEDAPTLAITNSTVVEGSPLSFVVSLSSQSPVPVDITFTVGGGTATAGQDYTYNGALSRTFAPGQTSLTITVPTYPGHIAGSVESVYVNLTSATVPIADSQGQGRIFETAPQTDIAALSFTGTTTSLTLTYVITGSTPSAFTVGLYAADGATVSYLQTVPLPAGYNATGSHSIRFAPTFADPGGSYTLKAVLDSGLAVAEQSETNNEATFSGVFVSREAASGSRVLHLQGGSGADTYTGSILGDSKLRLTSSGVNYDYYVGNLDQIDFRGQSGNDTLTMPSSLNISILAWGGDGNDTLMGGAANDYFYGGDGNDTFNSWDGDDEIHGDPGNDTIAAGGGNDFVEGNAGDDTLDGETGDDVLSGGTGNDALSGGTGFDSLFGGSGTNTVNTGGQNGDYSDPQDDPPNPANSGTGHQHGSILAYDDDVNYPPGGWVIIHPMFNDWNFAPTGCTWCGLSISSVSQPEHGSVTIANPHEVTYTPESGFTGDDSFTYTATNGVDSATATVHLTAPIVLVENALYAWEGGKLNLYLHATTTAGQISRFELDANDDHSYDYGTTAIDGNGEALVFDARDIGGLFADANANAHPVDDGIYRGMLRVTTTTDVTTIFPVEIAIGNVPPYFFFDAYDVLGQAGQTFRLHIYAYSTGPDTIAQMTVDWGDGTSNTYSPSWANTTHVYDADGHYTIRATATDEDGSTWAEHEIDIGDDSPPPVDNGDPVIISANAIILANGNAQLTVEAENSAGGNSDLTYEWDLDGDGIFETPSSDTVEIPDTANPYRYSGWIRVSDGAGRVTEAAVAFNVGGIVQILLSASPGDDYRKMFKDATPGIPESEWNHWDIHHPKQQQKELAARYLAERGINVHNLQDMRAVPTAVHEKFINPEQTRWWRNKAKELQIPDADWKLVYGDKRVKWADIDAFEASLNSYYSKYFVPAGSNKGSFDKVRNLANKDMAQLVLNKAKRMAQIGLLTLGALKIFETLDGRVQAFENARQFDPDTHAGFGKFVDKYEDCLNQALANNDRPAEIPVQQLVDIMFDFAIELMSDKNGHINENDAKALETGRALLHTAITKKYN